MLTGFVNETAAAIFLCVYCTGWLYQFPGILPVLSSFSFGFEAVLNPIFLIEHSVNNFVTIVVSTATPIWLPLSLACLECQSKEDDAKQMDNLHFFQWPAMMRAFVQEWCYQKFKCLKFGFWGFVMDNPFARKHQVVFSPDNNFEREHQGCAPTTP